MRPNEAQPRFFDAPICTAEALKGDGFIGSVALGGSCNVSKLTLIPHCNGTHTESISHIVEYKIGGYQAIKEALFPAVVVSVQPTIARDFADQYIPCIDKGNSVITQAQLAAEIDTYSSDQLVGLVIRTPNIGESKKLHNYNCDNYPAFLTNNAMRYIVSKGVRHLMVDMPSVDKMYDNGCLSNHHIFWNVSFQGGSRELSSEWLTEKTITEMIFVDDKIEDGFYLCNLQIPQIDSDAVPSRPVLFKLVEC